MTAETLTLKTFDGDVKTLEGPKDYKDVYGTIDKRVLIGLDNLTLESLERLAEHFGITRSEAMRMSMAAGVMMYEDMSLAGMSLIVRMGAAEKRALRLLLDTGKYGDDTHEVASTAFNAGLQVLVMREKRAAEQAGQ